MTRETILQRLPDTSLPGHEPLSERNAQPAPGAEERLVRAFTAAWEALGGTCELFENATAARLGLLLYLRELDYRQFLSWSLDSIPLPDLPSALLDTGITLYAPDRREIDPDISLGLTGADAGLAATGSIILRLAPQRSWIPALLPIRHVVILPTSRLYASLEDWRRAQGEQEQESSGNLLIITGPSENSDIELHPHRGMFGPRLVHLLLFKDA